MAKQADLFPTTSTPYALPQAERERIEAEIQAHLDAAEALIGRLDVVEPDPDLEDGGDDEPSLGAPSICGQCDLEGDSADDEPSLGWTCDMDQLRARRSCLDGGEDMEAEHDGREPDDADLEPSLGWTVSGCCGLTDDREQECEDEGACEMAREDLW